MERPAGGSDSARVSDPLRAVMVPTAVSCQSAPAGKKRKAEAHMGEGRTPKRLRVEELTPNGEVEAESSDEAKESDGEEWVEEESDEEGRPPPDPDFPLPSIECRDRDFESGCD